MIINLFAILVYIDTVVSIVMQELVMLIIQSVMGMLPLKIRKAVRNE